MRRETLALLACPVCRSALVAEPPGQDVVEGALRCSACGAVYPVRDGTPRFVEPGRLTGLNRRFSRLYDAFSWVYGAFSRVAFALIGMREAVGRRDVLGRLEPHGGRVLEVSVGNGVNLPWLIGAPDVGAVYGLDISPGQLRQARRVIQRRHWPVELFLGQAETLPFRDGAFDSVFHIGGINFFNDRKAAIDEMIRVARPGTRILIADETERGARAYEQTLPGFRSSFKTGRPAIAPPIGLIPANMRELRVSGIWKGWMYCIEFRTPG